MPNPSLKDLDLSSEEFKKILLNYLQKKKALRAIKPCLKIDCYVLFLFHQNQ